jgi:hypothetical protein
LATCEWTQKANRNELSERWRTSGFQNCNKRVNLQQFCPLFASFAAITQHSTARSHSRLVLAHCSPAATLGCLLCKNCANQINIFRNNVSDEIARGRARKTAQPDGRPSDTRTFGTNSTQSGWEPIAAELAVLAKSDAQIINILWQNGASRVRNASSHGVEHGGNLKIAFLWAFFLRGVPSLGSVEGALQRKFS